MLFDNDQYVFLEKQSETNPTETPNLLTFFSLPIFSLVFALLT